MAVEYRIISIGALGRNRLWGEGAQMRTAHATTTLVTDEDRLILVDPSLPGQILAARFAERTGKDISEVTDVFCTTLRPVHRRGIEALGHAKWWAGEQELESYGTHLEGLRDSAQRMSPEDEASVEADMKVLRRFSPAPEKFTRQVQLYPLYGPSVGSMGLLLTPAASTVVIAGDAAVTAEHVLRGQVWQGCVDIETATESLRDMLELAAVIIPGHDNVMNCPAHWL